jgi:polygalacturonase
MKFFYYLFLLIILFVHSFTRAQAIDTTDGWNNLDAILKNIIPPSFPDKDYDVTKFGAVGDGITDCSQAFKDAIEICSKNGGGRVVIPEGKFLTGAIYLKSNVNLYLSKGSTLLFSTDKNKYLPVVYTRFEGVECMNYSPFIYAYDEVNIAITGSGTINGQADTSNWWKWKKSYRQDNAQLQEWSANNTPVKDRIFGDGHWLRPNFIQPYNCKNVLIDSITIINSPMWEIHPVLSQNVTVSNVIINSNGPNNDGCDPECSKDVLIKNCFFNTGDDCIAIKSGRNDDGRRVNVPSENIIVQNCVMKDGHGGVVIGSEISGNIRNIYAENCIMDSPHLDRALRFKTNSIRGGVVENIYFRNIKIGQVKEAVLIIDYNYEEGDKGDFTPVMQNIKVKNITCEKAPYAILVNAYKRSPVKNLQLENCIFNNIQNENVLENVEGLILKSVIINGKDAESMK